MPWRNLFISCVQTGNDWVVEVQTVLEKLI